MHFFLELAIKINRYHPFSLAKYARLSVKTGNISSSKIFLENILERYPNSTAVSANLSALCLLDSEINYYHDLGCSDKYIYTSILTESENLPLDFNASLFDFVKNYKKLCYELKGKAARKRSSVKVVS